MPINFTIEQALAWFKKTVTQNYWSFTGRARRAEFWNFLILLLALQVVAFVLETLSGISFVLLLALALLMPSLGVLTRRLHDVGKGTIWLLLCLVPITGVMVLPYFAAQPGDQGTNSFGSDPRLEPEPRPFID